MPQAKNPATRNAADDQTEARTAEDTARGADNLPEQPKPEPAPEPDSHDDLVRRVANLERHVL